jgi:hypothetical protein
MQDISDILRSDIASFEKKLSELDHQKLMILVQIEYARRLLGESKEVPREMRDPIVQTSAQGSPYEHSPAHLVVYDILLKEDGPLKLGEIAKRAIGGGYMNGTATLEKVVPNFSSMLSRIVETADGQFIRLSRGVFDLRGRSSKEQIHD